MGKMKDLFDDTLFEPDEPEPEAAEPKAHARRTDPSTSHEAARKFTAKKLTEVQEQVLLLFKTRRELTDWELEQAFNFSGSTHRTRRSELVERGLVRNSGRRKFQANSNRIIWEIVP